MIYKEDWDKSKKRYEAFWQGAVVDRCCCSITSPRGKPLFPGLRERTPENLEQKWLDIEFRLEQTLYAFANTYFGGDAYPMSWINLGPGVAAAFMGAGARLAQDTVWFGTDLLIKDWSARQKLAFDMQDTMWKAAWNLTRFYCQSAGNDFLVGITDLGGSLDIAASLRGGENLLYDLYDCPDEVKKLTDEVDEVWKQAYDRLQGFIDGHQEGSSAWMGMWCPGRWSPLQCDFSAMISREMFDEFVRPSLVREAGWLDHAIYHLDGPGEICHLDSILEIEKIDGIQCVPDTTYRESAGHFYKSYCNELWVPVMKKIQGKGKLLVLNDVHLIELEGLMEHLSPEGLFITMSCKNEDEAGEVMKRIEKLR